MKPLDKKRQFDNYLLSVRKFTNELLIPDEEILEKEGFVSERIMSEIKSLGLFGISIPEEYGGLDFTMEEQNFLFSISLFLKMYFIYLVDICPLAIVTPTIRENLLFDFYHCLYFL